MPDSSSHARKPFRRAGRLLAVLAWCALIFAASDRPDLRVSDDDALDFVLRKLAHLAVFGVLALLVLWVALADGASLRTGSAIAWFATLAYAIGDEWHQTFVDGRVGHASDVAIDMAGATIALALAALRLRPASTPGST